MRNPFRHLLAALALGVILAAGCSQSSAKEEPTPPVSTLTEAQDNTASRLGVWCDAIAALGEAAFQYSIHGAVDIGSPDARTVQALEARGVQLARRYNATAAKMPRAALAEYDLPAKVTIYGGHASIADCTRGEQP